jgi:hypothetical protein
MEPARSIIEDDRRERSVACGAMSKAGEAARRIADESKPTKFVARLRKMPLLRRIFAIIDRFLCVL